MTTPPRTDLLALTPDTLAALTNRGLVRRATKELDSGTSPELRDAPGGGVTARFADGSEAAMPPGASLDSGTCTCAAAGVCRHLIGLVLAYGRAADPAPPGEGVPDWSPGDIDDAALAAAVGPRALTAARRSARRGASVRVHRPTALEPHPWVELPTCTVRFPVPGQAAHALTDAADSLRGEMLALAVWAFRAADATDRQASLVLVPLQDLGAPTPAPDAKDRPRSSTAPAASPAPDASPQPSQPEDPPLETATSTSEDTQGTQDPQDTDAADAAERRSNSSTAPSAGRPRSEPATASPLHQVAELAAELLRDGVAHADAVQRGALRTAARRLAVSGAHWPAAAAAELADQLDAHADRSALHRPEEVATLLAELHARHRAASHPEVLGVREATETPLRRVRLTALGCRVSGNAERPVTEVYFAHAAAGIVVVLRKDWPEPERRGVPPIPATGAHPSQPPPPSAVRPLAARRLLGTSLSALATGNLVSESARRTPSRRLTVTRGRVAATTVSPVGRSWCDLPEPLLVRDVTRLAAAADARPPRLIRARVEAESVRVLEISEVVEVGYDPAEQVLKATVSDASGHPVRVRAPHNPLCPAALDALAAALTEGTVTHLSGAVHRSGGGTGITPLALLGPHGVLVPDLAPPTVPPALPPADRTPPDPITTAVEAALAVLADAAHHGLRRLPRPAADRLREAADRLTRTGLTTSSNLVRTLLHALDHDHQDAGGHRRDHAPHHGQGRELSSGHTTPPAPTTAWADACIRLHTTAELSHRHD
ncbi:hypothetical protein PV755_26420 [Streptomyces caniscabiei]|uniref:SWIM-type domain-containing protein n=1 Tax=Streptomyces caniscabiei TaxID=2746961 RepID=A0A927L625_9ACTN|nr:hypothetical protein [Streptomyces caniscabiei]MBD9726247.1 hypothetical protein [Streptomyces caniscabiei]MDX3512420.1 hypothetical protein [Streptomyces caniscabiei]MDX3721773.1 hypothetical protein [Streptomyces caniscabiei]WEO28639.1 hypothetical protein IHE65_38735 [Streptomyces caniscabiei]